jgi:ribosome biogenesis GTPase A
MEAYWDLIKQIVRESDIILEVLDARAIEISRNEELEKIIKAKERPRIYVINKIDLVNRRDLENLVGKIKTDANSQVVYLTRKDRRTARNLLVKIKQMFAKFGKRKDFYTSPILARPYREAKADIVVGVVGYPNVGKSSVINAISFKSKAKVSSKAGTTHGIHWINCGDNIKLIDTPGVIPLVRTDETNLGIISARNTEKLKEPDVVAAAIIDLFLKAGRIGKIEQFYGFKIEESDKENPYFILERLAFAKGHLKKGGIADEKRTSIMFVKDWQKGALKL